MPGKVRAGERTRQDVVTCRGPFAKDTSHARLVSTFGRANVRLGYVQGGERERLRGSILYGTRDARRLEFIWDDVRGRKLSFIRVKGASKWRIASGLAVGTSIAEVVRLNGKPFRLSGFGWDYGGHVVDWQHGALSRPLDGGCRIDVTFYLGERAPDRVVEKVTGEESFSSDNANMIAARAAVGTLNLVYQE